MIRITLSKIKQVCVLTFVPKAFRGGMHCPPGRIEKLSHDAQRKDKSPCPASNTKRDEEEKCQSIIDRIFEPNLPHLETLDLDAKHIILSHMASPELPPSKETHCEKCQRIINEIFGDDKSDCKTLQATAKDDAEKLTQKIEHIEEIPLVEAQAPKYEGFNLPPKVLGGRRKRKDVYKHIPILNSSIDKPVYSRRRFAIVNCSDKSQKRKRGQVPTFDDLAKRCLDSPSNHIDERLLKEMEQLGVPPSSGRGSRKGFDDSDIIQADIMKKPRKPVEKIELDFATSKKIELGL